MTRQTQKLNLCHHDASLDADDPIFPRQVTRLGQRFQGVIPTWEEQQELEKERAAGPEQEDSKSSYLENDFVKRWPVEPFIRPVPERGNDSTIVVISLPEPNRKLISVTYPPKRTD
jgi:hypothetical protein